MFEALVASDKFEPSLERVVQQLSSMAPSASQDTKKSLNEIAAGHYDQAVLSARSESSALGQEFAEGRQAFALRRAPRFREI